MSKETFSMKVRMEAAEAVSSRRHCQLAELAGMLSTGAECSKECIEFSHENEQVAKKVFTLIRKTYKISPDVTVVRKSGSKSRSQFKIRVTQRPLVDAILMGIKMMASAQEPEAPVDDLLLQKSCCKRAFVRGCFLAGGSVTDPAKSYHLEIVCPTEKKVSQLCGIIHSFWDEEGREIKYTIRRRNDEKQVYVMYVKEGDQIADLLNICECYRSLMEMENIRVTKEIANSLNRRQNCEMANMAKTISAAQEQKNDICYIHEQIGIEKLPADLRGLAELRMNDTEMSLKELGEALNPPVSKSCVNHRLRRIKKIADELRLGCFDVDKI